MIVQLLVLWAVTSRSDGLSIPLEVPQPPSILSHSPSPVLAFPYDASVSISCEAMGNPPPQYRWTKDGQDFTPPQDATTQTGTFVIFNKQFVQFQGKYTCFASNSMGTAMTEEIHLIASGVPKFPKEAVPAMVVNEGDPMVLQCNPPPGLPPPQIYWMSVDLQHIEQDDRVSMGIDGNLYFANVIANDSRQDYSCVAAFSRIRTIAQKSPMIVQVQSVKDPVVRMPSLLLPSGVQTEVVILKGNQLQLECLPAGLPTPKIEWIKMGDTLAERTQFDKFGKMLIISNIEERDEGKYMCKASNVAGEDAHYFDVIVEEPPQWHTEPPQNQLTVMGTRVHIKCSVRGKPTPDIRWMKNGNVFTGDQVRQQYVEDDSVVLQNTSPEDSGVYQCEASNSHGTILANVNIMVMNLAPVILSRTSQYAVVEGADVLLNCSVFGSPPPDVYWIRNESLQTLEGERYLNHQNNSLQIFAAEKDDSGQYVCVASNSEGRSKMSAALEVKDRTRILRPPQDAQVVSGSTARLRCEAQVDKSLEESVEVVWTKDAEDVPLTATETQKFSAGEGVLQIFNVGLSDMGNYMCVVRTSLDQDQASAMLTVLDVPDAPTNVQLLELKGPKNVLLSWTPGSDHNSSITEFIVEYEESQWEPGRWKQFHKVPGNQATVELLLHGHLTYQFRVYGVNTVGPGPPSEPTDTHKTPPAAPDRNPENIKILGHLPHQMDISWEPLLPMEHNGPGLEYKVSYRKLGVEDVWTEHLLRRHSFVVRNTSTFVPYEVKVQSRNSHGWGPEPKVVTGYSGEDVPTAAPQDVAVEVMNTTLLRVSWTPVPPATVRGHLGGYDVQWVRKRSLLKLNSTLDQRQTLSFRGKRSHAVVPGLQPFSEYTLTVNVFNKKGKGPNSDPVRFTTPEGVPKQVPILTTSNARTDSIVLVWGPPTDTDGVLTGYLLQYHLMNQSSQEVVSSVEVNISGADTTRWQLQGLQEHRLYRFHLSACTRAGCGPLRAQESYTATHTVPVLFNISWDVSDTFAKLSWSSRGQQNHSYFYVSYMNNRDGNWWISEAVNTSHRFHIIDGLKPGTVYTVRLLAQNTSIFQGVFQTRTKGQPSSQRDVSSQAWFIGTMCAVALLTLIALIACFLRRNKGGKYAGTPLPPQPPETLSMDPVKEKEDLHPDVESPGMTDDPLCEYSSDGEEKPLKAGSSCSLMGRDSVSRDSLGDYADGGGEFSEDGSFIGQYSELNHQGSVTSGPG